MLKTLYKYSLPHPQIFNNLLIRATQRYSLNDPFELRPSSENILDKLSNVSVKTVNEYKASYDDYGVISFTETYNNLLMWAHYANDHKGIVIEFDLSKLHFNSYQSYPLFEVDKNDEIFAAKNPIIKTLNEGSLQKVRYSNRRPSEYGCDSILEHFLVKSDDWSYEKEHRAIIPLLTAESIIIKKGYLGVIDDLLGLDYSYVTHDFGNGFVMVSFDEPLRSAANEDYYITDNLLTEEEFYQSYKLAFLAEILSTISIDSSSIFLYRLPPNSIKRIFFGCRMAEVDKKVIMHNIERNSELHQIEFLSAKTSKSRFELDFVEFY
ncbi:DUF2971 domain-containing protein [Methylophaga thalassica]|uniref:DUF2971 domain-containing protein n=1 Tax=Methylophaga thalassica TaxID=40223 RepID=UPI0025493BB2|nr:DUF2971 domain-containing protein [Methylophaga thalassica]